MIDVNHRCYILFVHGSRWLGVRLDLLAALCVTVAAACVLILRNHIAAGIAGVVLVQSLQLTGLFQVRSNLVFLSRLCEKCLVLCQLSCVLSWAFVLLRKFRML